MSAVDPRLAWMLESAEILTRGRALPVQIRHLLKELDVDLIKEVEPKRDGSGELRKSSRSNYQIVLFRATDAPRPLRPRERFTVAHEIGHLLLEERYQWHPTTSADYHLREDFCNQFAAHLLIPEEQLDQLLLPSATAALGHLLHVSQTCRVSLEVAARRIAGHVPNIAYVTVIETKNRGGERVFASLWGAGRTGNISMARRKHFRYIDPLGRFLLENKVSHGYQTEFSLAEIGEGAVRPLQTGALLIALVAPQDTNDVVVSSRLHHPEANRDGKSEWNSVLSEENGRETCSPGQVL